MIRTRTLFVLVSLLGVFACRQTANQTNAKTLPENKQTLSPDQRYGALFEAVQMGGIFPDSKTFVDCTPKFATDEILRNYEQAKSQPGFDLKAFVTKHFSLPKKYASGFKSDTSRTVLEHINALWPVLTRKPDAGASTGTLIPLPKSYIVPGGRFGEIYYWDSYFTMLGLQAVGKMDMIENMADNFAYLINEVGYIPNGNRRYFLGRSQPPFFAAIITLLAKEKGKSVHEKYLPALEKEYEFWMSGLTNVNSENPTHRRVVRMEDGSILNRYFDDQPVPRPESHREDVELAEGVKGDKTKLYEHLRAACESGWDFSSRWFKDGQYLASIHTTDIIPVDLNALLFHLEEVLAKAYTDKDQEKSEFYRQRAVNRKRSLLKHCWDDQTNFFVDYDFIKRSPTDVPSLAAMYPLYFNMANEDQAKMVATKITKEFLKPGGVATTLNKTGQQWDAPNGWAPLQWMTIQGLRNYGHEALASTIRERWINLNTKVYKNTGKMVEKYNVFDMELEAGGGEYPVQDGFGWTNGVLLRLLMEGKTKTEEAPK